MAYLTEFGLIGQPHTSAGRVPTSRGIRYYIDNLMTPYELHDREKNEIDSIFSDAESDPERFIVKASDRLADKLGCAVLGTTTASTESRIDKIEVIRASENMFVVVLITTDKEAKSKLCNINYPISDEDLELFKRAVNSELSKTALLNVSVSLIQSVAVKIGPAGLSLSPLLFSVLEICKGIFEEKLFIEGEANLLAGGLSRAGLRRIKQLAQNGELAALISEETGKTEIILGNEFLYDDLSPLSLILTHYNIGSSSGAVGLIGPVRTNYAKLIPCLEYFAKSFSRYYSDSRKSK
jgi:heat-inducible transcriptional repressor